MTRARHCGACGSSGHDVRSCNDDVRFAAFLLGQARDQASSSGAELMRTAGLVSSARSKALAGDVIEALEWCNKSIDDWPVDNEGKWPAAVAMNKVLQARNRLTRFVEAGR
jgi:hypothetical protein